MSEDMLNVMGSFISTELDAFENLHKELEEKDKEIERLNNIINELEKDFEWQLKKQADIDKFAEEQGFLNYNPVRLMVEHFKDKLQELKGSGSNE